MEKHNWHLNQKYQEITDNEIRWEEFEVDDADQVIVAFGTAARIAKGAIRRLREDGIKIGLFRPISLWPYPTKQLRALVDKGINKFVVFELNLGQSHCTLPVSREE